VTSPLPTLLATVLLAGCTTGRRGLTPSEGVPNLGQVNPGLYRAAEPDPAGMEGLRRIGIRAIIDLQMPREVRFGEAAEAHGFGMVYTNVPMRGLGRPTDAQVDRVLALIESLPPPVLVHCQHGCDRTGTIIACYRIRHDGWNRARALAEARRYGMSGWEWGMKDYVLAVGEGGGRH